MVEPPKTNSDRKTNTMYHMHNLKAPNVCMWYIVLILQSLLVLGGSTLVEHPHAPWKCVSSNFHENKWSVQFEREVELE